jgi:hypothetical protein
VSAAPPSEYEDDAARIEQAGYIPSGATTQAEIEAALASSGFPSSAIPEIASWLATESDAWDAVGPSTQDAGSVTRAVDRASGGVIAPERARTMGESVSSEINRARSEAAQRVTDNGQVRGENGRFVGKIQNVEEQVENDGIYFENTETGTRARAARFDK